MHSFNTSLPSNHLDFSVPQSSLGYANYNDLPFPTYPTQQTDYKFDYMDSFPPIHPAYSFHYANSHEFSQVHQSNLLPASTESISEEAVCRNPYISFEPDYIHTDTESDTLSNRYYSSNSELDANSNLSSSSSTKISTFISLSCSDVSLSDMEESLARTSVNDVYLGPVCKDGKLISLDPSTRDSGDCVLLPYSSSSLAFSPPGIIIVSEMWSLFVNNKLSYCNHLIHELPPEMLRKCLYDHGLNQLGSLNVLRRRLQEFVRRVREAQVDADRRSHQYGTLTEKTSNFIAENQTAESSADAASQPMRMVKFSKPVILTPDMFYTYLLIIDLEATCDQHSSDGTTFGYPHEIIEFPILLYNTRTRRCECVFHAYCRPLVQARLSSFCTSLTHIKQRQVDQSEPFLCVLARIEHWLFERHRLAEVRCAIVCDCSADMGKFMRLQCHLSGIPMPAWAGVWINLSKAFRLFYKYPSRHRVTLKSMLRELNLSFVGQHHSGMDDSINILRVTRTMLADGCRLRVNERIDLHNGPPYVASVPRLIAEITGGLMGSELTLLAHKHSGPKSHQMSPDAEFQ